MKCTKCGSKTQIIETRQRKRIANAKDSRYAAAGPTVFRRHECLNPNCRNRFSTYEVVQNDYQKMLLLVDAAQKTEKALKSTNADLTALIRNFSHIK